MDPFVHRGTFKSLFWSRVDHGVAIILHHHIISANRVVILTVVSSTSFVLSTVGILLGLLLLSNAIG